MTKPESETDPWAKVRTFDVSTYGDCRMERDYYGEIASEQKYQRGEYAWVDEVDAARAAEAAQHRQFKAAIATALCVENEHGPVSEESIVEAAEVTLGQLFDLSARLAAVEAERDKQAEQIADLTMHKASRDSQLGCLLEDIGGKKYPTMNEARDQIAAWKAMTAERDRLKAALERLRDCDWTIGRGDRMDAVRDIARAALTPQGQSTDGETR